ncbi:MAG: hypothetical protein D6811_10785 [Alphaproteobacteria bacterium]|nr:MAG: hypothetical protein D6811_10785 [Alphaproteobacteria bacterium]
MSTIMHSLATLRRPRLLISAARHGLADYNRSRDLARLLRRAEAPAPQEALGELVTAEAEIEATRTARSAGYSAARHGEVLTALLGELRLTAGGSEGQPA